MKLYALLLVLLAQIGQCQHVHSHNDYQQDKPLFTALQAKSYSIEVDVWAAEGQLFVAHDSLEIQTDHTFESLYLMPLAKLPVRPKLQILIDVKSAPYSTLDLIIKKLKEYPSLLLNKQMKFVISGNRPAPSEYDSYPEFIYFDHQNLDKLDEINTEKIALISLPFYKLSFWKGKTIIPTKDQQRILRTLQKVHEQGLPLRLWASPDTELAWKTLQKLKLDYINTDQPKSCASVLNKNI